MSKIFTLFIVILVVSFLQAQETAPTLQHSRQYKLGYATSMSASISAKCEESPNHAENVTCVNAFIKKLTSLCNLQLTRLKPLVQRPFLTNSNPDMLLVTEAEKNYAPTIKLTAYDAEDNSVLWTESRTLIDLDNDVAKLYTHFSQARIAAREGQ